MLGTSDRVGGGRTTESSKQTSPEFTASYCVNLLNSALSSFPLEGDVSEYGKVIRKLDL